MTSARVRGSLRHLPRTAEVIISLPAFLIPRQVMHVWVARRTTATPLASSFSVNRSATSDVSRSWTCGRWAKTSSTRASLEMPTTLPSGR